jgi:hypothetical protein
MIGPIDGRGGNFLDRFPRLAALQDLIGRHPVAPPEPMLSQPAPVGRLGAATDVGMQVSQMLQAIGSGVQDDKLLQMLITLLVLAAMMQDSQATQTAANSLLDGLARGTAFRAFESISITTTEITCQMQYSIGPDAPTAQPQNGLDATA